MYYEIYLDVVFLINMIFEFVILRLTGSVMKRKSTLFRSFLAAFTGSGLLCVMLVLRGSGIIMNPFIPMSVCDFLMITIAFYRKKEKTYKILSIAVVFYMISCLVSGVLNMIYGYTKTGYYWNAFVKTTENKTVSWYFVCIGAAIVLCVGKSTVLLIQKKQYTKSIYWDVSICIGNYKKVITALVDSGNHLAEPISGKPVHVIEIGVISDIMNPDFIEAVKRFYDKKIIDEGLYHEKGMRIIPFRAIGTPNEKLLVGIVADRIMCRNHIAEYEIEKPYIALYDGILASDESYHMLLHGREMMRRN